MHILDFIPFIKHFHSFAYWFAFMAAMLETFIGRFIPSLRETVLLIAGISNMEKKIFFIWNIYINFTNWI